MGTYLRKPPSGLGVVFRWNLEFLVKQVCKKHVGPSSINWFDYNFVALFADHAFFGNYFRKIRHLLHHFTTLIERQGGKGQNSFYRPS